MLADWGWVDWRKKAAQQWNHLRKSKCVQSVGEGQTPKEGGPVYARTLEPGRVCLEHTVAKPGDGPVLLFPFSAWAGQHSRVGSSPASELSQPLRE